MSPCKLIKLLEKETGESLEELVEDTINGLNIFPQPFSLECLREKIFFEKGFSYAKGSNAFKNFLTTKTGDCVDFAILYRLILNRLQRSSAIVSARGHLVIQLGQDDQEYLEPTEGRLISRDFYIRSRGISAETINRGIYLSAFNERDVMAAYLNKLTKTHFNDKEYDSAKRLLEKSVRYSSKLPEVFYNLGCVHKLQGDFKKATEYFRKTLSLDHSFEQAHNNIGICSAKLGDVEEARQHFTRAFQTGRCPEALYNLKLSITRYPEQ